VVCGVGLTALGAKRFEKHRVEIREKVQTEGGDRFFPIKSGERVITLWDSTVSMNPPGFYFVGRDWPEVRAKALAICPDKVPQDVPQQVLAHRPQPP